MPISNVSDEIKIAEKLFKRDSDLFTRMDKDWGHFRGNEFTMPKESGTWKNVTSNRAKAVGWFMINTIGMAGRKIYLLNRNAKEKEREEISDAEIVANSLLYSAERGYDSDPLLPTMQMAMSFYAVLRGWRCLRPLVMEDDDEGTYLDLAIWDRRHVAFISGQGRLLKVFHERFATEEEVKDEYDYEAKVDEKGLVKITEAWDCSERGKPAEQAIIIDKEFVKEPEKVKVGGAYLDYIPVRIKPCGGIPLIGDDNTDNIAHVGESFLVNNRELLNIESEILTYERSRAAEDAQTPIILKYDSNRTDLPGEMKKEKVKGRFIYLDTFKGEDLANYPPLPPAGNINLMHQQVQNMLDIGDPGPLAFGSLNTSQTATGIDILNKNIMKHLYPYTEGLGQDYAWLAAEITSQYSRGSFKESEFKYYSSSQKMYETRKLMPSTVKKVLEKAGNEFKCDIIMDSLRDRATQIDMFSKAVTSGATSRRGGLDMFQLSEDVDQTLKEISQERSDALFGLGEVRALGAMIEDYVGEPKGDINMEQYLAELYKKNPIKALEIDIAWQKLQQIQNQVRAETMGGGQELPGGQIMPEVNRGNRLPANTARVPQPNMPANIPGGNETPQPNMPANIPGGNETPEPIRQAVRKAMGARNA